MKIEIYSDYACPYCYIGHKRLLEAVESIDFKDEIKVINRSFVLDERAPKVTNKNAYESLSEKYNISVDEAKQMIGKVERMGETAGIKFRFDINKPTNTFDAHRLTKFAKIARKERTLLLALFEAYFINGKNIASKDDLIKIATSVGLDKIIVESILNSDQYLDIVMNDLNTARRRNVRSVPFIIINNRYFISGARKTEDIIQSLIEIRKNEHERTYCDADTCPF